MNTQIKNVILMTFSLLLISFSAQARDYFEIQLVGPQQTNKIIYLKRQLQRQFRVNPEDYNLISATATVAHRPRGRRHIQSALELHIDGRLIDWATLSTSRGDHYWTQKVSLHNRNFSDGAWQIKAFGPIAVTSVLLVVDEKYRHRRPPRRPPGYGRTRTVSLGVFTAEKLVEVPHQFSLSGKFVRDITLRGVDETARVTNVLIEYENGQAEVLYRLHGSLRERDRVSVRINRFVRKITVTAVSADLVGSRAEVEVLASVAR